MRTLSRSILWTGMPAVTDRSEWLRTGGRSEESRRRINDGDSR